MLAYTPALLFIDNFLRPLPVVQILNPWPPPAQWSPGQPHGTLPPTHMQLMLLAPPMVPHTPPSKPTGLFLAHVTVRLVFHKCGDTLTSFPRLGPNCPSGQPPDCFSTQAGRVPLSTASTRHMNTLPLTVFDSLSTSPNTPCLPGGREGTVRA